MSTTINVTVGGNGLLDQSRQQMQANRFGRLERDQDAKVQADAQQVQDAKKKTDDLAGRVLQQRRLSQEPAANRRDQSTLMLLPRYAPVVVPIDNDPNTNGTDFALHYYPCDDFKRKAKSSDGISNDVLYAKARQYTTDSNGPSSFTTSFLADGGPSGKSALALIFDGPDSYSSTWPVELEFETQIADDKRYLLYDPAPAAFTCEFYIRPIGASDAQLILDFIDLVFKLSNYPADNIPGTTSLSIGFTGGDRLPISLLYSDVTEWTHIAFVYTASSLLEVFVNGNLAASVDISAAPSTPTIGLSGAIFNHRPFSDSPASYGEIRLHGPRITAKALYSGSFTPPAFFK